MTVLLSVFFELLPLILPLFDPDCPVRAEVLFSQVGIVFVFVEEVRWPEAVFIVIVEVFERAILQSVPCYFTVIFCMVYCPLSVRSRS